MFINKNIVSCLTAVAVAASLLFTSCLKIDDGQESAYGYLTIEGFDLDVVVEPLLPTKGETVALTEVYGYDSENHKPVLTTVTVKPENGSSISYELDGNALKLPVGKYTLSASSGINGFGKPYFVGEVEVEIKSMKQTTASIVFSLGNSVLKVVNDMPDHFIPVGESPVKISSSTGSVHTALETYVFVPSQEELTIQVEGKSSAEVPNTFETVVSATTAKTAYEVVITAGNALPSFTLPEQSNGAWGGRLYINPVTSVTGISSDNLAKIVYEVYSDAACETRISSSAEGGTVVDGLQNGSQYYVRAKVGNLYSENTVGPVTVMAPMVTNAHYNDSDGNLAGTNSTLDLKLNDFLNERISIGEITLDKGNVQVRSTPASGQNILSVSEGWPYLPAGTDYTLKVQHKLKTESEYKEFSKDGIEVSSPFDKFTVTASANTTYSYYTSPSKGATEANKKTAENIFDVTSTVSISNKILENPNYKEILPSVTYSVGEKTAEGTFSSKTHVLNSEISDLSWGTYSLTAKVKFDGAEQTSQGYECIITGLPYNAPSKIKFDAEDVAWTKVSGNMTSVESDKITLRSTAGDIVGQEPEIKGPAFHIPSNVNTTVTVGCNIHSQQVLFWYLCTLSVKVNGSTIISQESGKSKDNEYTLSNSATFTPTENYVVMETNVYAVKERYAEITRLDVLYK